MTAARQDTDPDPDEAGIEPLCADVETWVEHVYAPVVGAA
jgi:hypothetical protein